MNEGYEDSRGLLWIATSEGLNSYDRKNDEIIIPVHDSPLGTDIIQAIIEDNNKNMWITTTSSISNVIVSTDPRTGVYTYDTYQYGELDGLQGQQFNTRSITKTFRARLLTIIIIIIISDTHTQSLTHTHTHTHTRTHTKAPFKHAQGSISLYGSI